MCTEGPVSEFLADKKYGAMVCAPYVFTVIRRCAFNEPRNIIVLKIGNLHAALARTPDSEFGSSSGLRYDSSALQRQGCCFEHALSNCRSESLEAPMSICIEYWQLVDLRTRLPRVCSVQTRMNIKSEDYSNHSVYILYEGAHSSTCDGTCLDDTCLNKARISSNVRMMAWSAQLHQWYIVFGRIIKSTKKIKNQRRLCLGGVWW
jgi:hypothetical protein